MTIKDANAYDPWKTFSGPNIGYVIGQYDLFQTNPEEVDPGLRSFFEVSGPPSLDATVGAVLANVTTQPVGKPFQ